MSILARPNVSFKYRVWRLSVFFKYEFFMQNIIFLCMHSVDICNLCKRTQWYDSDEPGVKRKFLSIQLYCDQPMPPERLATPQSSVDPECN